MHLYSDVVPFAYPLTAVVTLLTLLLFFVLSLNVGRARMKYGVPAPRIDGPEEFQRIYRFQSNTVEQLWLFMPLLWLTSITAGDATAAAIGAFWPIARILYANGYYASSEHKSRAFGFGFGMIVIASLFVLTLVGLIPQLY